MPVPNAELFPLPPPPASRFVQVLVHLDTTQQEVAAALKDNTVLLAEVGPRGGGWGGSGPYSAPPAHSLPPSLPPTQVQKTMKENLAVVEDNFAEVEARIKRLQK